MKREWRDPVCLGKVALLAIRPSGKAPGQECASHSLLVRFWDNLEKPGDDEVEFGR